MACNQDPNAQATARNTGARAEQRAETLRRFRRLRALNDDDPERGALRAALIEDHLTYARHIALRYGGRGELVEDFVQVAYLALVKAVDQFDPERGTAFLGYATPVMLGEIKKYFRDATWDVHVPRSVQELTRTVRAAAEQLTRQLARSPSVAELAEHVGAPAELVTEALVALDGYTVASLDRPLRGEPGAPSLGDLIGGEDARFETVVNRTALKPLIAQLNERDRSILMMHFFHGMTQREIGARLGCSQMHISRLLASVLARLRTALC
ncbi:SigB/SigF/SigG family RNA polymerase sigma factor [Actinocrinis puniceicyclus]|uniref:SigB/SigF/SigG family RNA polymerase sigma factor n=1 Tax=Actinocrinis puniceicyclus TaxID=977794 RepID=A0A8J7WL74_9ACTN|nr:SigB/SigF/SigG family RNA polymerase sigma factor [Actinocrinis puniceicyclus]MBS2963348.1 SigB/SigF/SigG family RNA polymerase sigma factor [Actinocrinis puniceicyclus]